jgi:hypothetical protein
MVRPSERVPRKYRRIREMRLPGVMHVEAHLLNGKSNIQTGEGQILQGASETVVLCGVSDRRSIYG